MEYAFQVIGYRGRIFSQKKKAVLFCQLDCVTLEADFLMTNGLLDEVVFEYPTGPSVIHRAGYVIRKLAVSHPDPKKRETQQKQWSEAMPHDVTIAHLLRGITLHLTEYEATRAQSVIEKRLSEIAEVVGLALYNRDSPGRTGGL